MNLNHFKKSGFVNMIKSLGPEVDLNNVNSMGLYLSKKKRNEHLWTIFRLEIAFPTNTSMFYTANSGF